MPLLLRQFSKGIAAREEPQNEYRLRRYVLRRLLVLYAAWFVLTMRDKSRAHQWGSTTVARVFGATARVVLGAFGVRSCMRFDGLPENTYPTVSERLVTSDAALFTIFPHGAYPLSMLALCVPAFRTDPALSTFRLRLAGASVLYSVPVVRELLLLLGGREASEPTMRRCFAEGCSVALCPGGIYEQVHTDHTQEQVFVQKRLGFIRCARAAGKP
jgi:hypothetical protein